MELNPLVDKFLVDGCMRCKYGATPQCKVNTWRSELELLRQIMLESGLKEELKWGSPVYTLNGANIVSVSVLKDAAIFGFFKGALLSDSAGILSQQGNVQAGRIVRITSTDQVSQLTPVLKAYVAEAIAIEESGQKVEMKKNPEPVPTELIEVFEQDPAFARAFQALTLGRQRGYIIHFSQPKQSATRHSRIAKYKQQIMEGIGLHDKYKSE